MLPAEVEVTHFYGTKCFIQKMSALVSTHKNGYR